MSAHNVDPVTGRILGEDGTPVNLVTLFGDGVDPIGASILNPDQYAPLPGRVIGEDGHLYSLATILQNISSRLSALENVRIIYDANGGTGEMTDPNAPYPLGTAAEVLGCSYTPPDGKVFVSWDINPPGASYISAYDAGNYIVLSSNITLYAVWADAE